MSMDNILLSLALVLVLEGIWPMLFPNKWRRYIQSISELPTSQIQMVGGILVIIGVVCSWLILS